MLEDTQKSLLELRQRLDEEIQAFQRRQQVSTASKNVQQKRRTMIVLSKDETFAFIQVSGNARLKLSKPEVEKRIQQNRSPNIAVSSAPLKVIVGAAHDSNSTSGEYLTGSPASSVDSGMYSLSPADSPPSSSPGSSPVAIHSMPFQYKSNSKEHAMPHPRMRSVSECAGVNLKGILKKTTPSHMISGRFTRTCSECQEVDEESADIIGIIGKEENGEEIPPRQQKRVSFSERLVQERSFRPNSSILGQKKKNQRKQKNKLRKRLGSTSEETEDEGYVRADSESSHDEVFEESEEGVNAAACDLISCDLGEDKEKQSCHDAAKVDELTMDRPRVFFTVGDELCQC